MKKRMDEFEESLNCINIRNNITELRNYIKQLENKYKYAMIKDNMLSDDRINNRNEELKNEENLNNRSNPNTRNNTRSTQVKVNNPILHQNMDNSID